jgi:3-methylcrotonyl-CoA carboxylase alpha subunit/geranyl-CoA carboxylase alpha subunit
VVSHHYDSLLAKVIAHGRDRDEARRRLRRALGNLDAAGVALNSVFLRELLALPDFADGTPHTGLIQAIWPEGWRRPATTPGLMIEAALTRHLSVGGAGGSPWQTLGAWRVTDPAGRAGAAVHYVRAPGGPPHRVRLFGRSGDLLRAELDDEPAVEIRNASFADGRLDYDAAGIRRRCRVARSGETITLFDGDTDTALEVLSPERALLGAAAETTGEGDVTAPMPGCVVEVRVEAGQTVRAGDTLCVIEAMKLFQSLAAPFDGTVAALRCAPGDNVSGGALLLVVAPATTDDNEPDNSQ